MKQSNNHQTTYLIGCKPKMLALTIAMVCSTGATAAQQSVLNVDKQPNVSLETATTVNKSKRPTNTRKYSPSPFLAKNVAAPTSPSTNIVGGQETNPGEYPFIVSMAISLSPFLIPMVMA